MGTSRRRSVARRPIALAVALSGLALFLTGCAGGTAERAAPTAPHVVTIEGALTGENAALLRQSWAGWEKVNHITIRYTSRSNFQDTVGGEAQKGTAPDLAIISQPVFIQDLAALGYLQPLPTSVTTNVTSNFPAAWAQLTTSGGTNYAAPLLASENGWIFYSPQQFQQWGVSIPSTWGQLLAITKTIQQKTGEAPWCEGFSAGAQSGTAGAEWIDDLVLRFDGPGVYDQWVAHQIPFSDARIEGAFDELGLIMQNPSYVNGGIGGVSTISTSTTTQVAAALQSGKCAMTHQPLSFARELTDANGGPANIGTNGDFWAFQLPPPTQPGARLTGGGEFVAAFSHSSDTVKVQQFLSSAQWATVRVRLGGAISPDPAVPAAADAGPLLEEATQLLHNPSETFRFDAFDVMPSSVGDGTFLSGMNEWANGKPVTQILAKINAAWPTS